jgi:Bacterial membrane protein YfhO
MPHRGGLGRGWPSRPEDPSLIAPTSTTLAGSVALSEGAPPAVGGAPRPRAAAGRGWHGAPEVLQAAFVLTGLLLVFFWTPLSQRGYYAPTDLLQSSELLRIAPPDYVRKNPLMADPVDQFHPWLRWSREELRAGRLPLWDPYNGWGAPFVANYQSAVFSPFSFPFYLLSFRAALVVVAFLRLFGLGLFTYLFLRRVGLVHMGALVGAVAFMFSGYSVLWLNWTFTGVLLALPAGLYFIELACQTTESQVTRRGFALIGFALALAVGLVAGHPETFFFSAWVLGAYLLIRLARIGGALPWRARRVLEFGLAAGVSVGLSAGQLLPFMEYLQHSTALAARNTGGAYDSLNAVYLTLRAFPDLLGSPSLGYYDPVIANSTPYNYSELNGGYSGLAVLFLAGIAVATLPLHRSPLVAFFAAVGLAWLIYAYNILGLGDWISTLPVIRLGLVHRSPMIWLFAASSLAAKSVDLLAMGRLDPRRGVRGGIRQRLLLIGGLALWGLVLLVVARLGADRLLDWAAQQPGNQVGSPPARAVVDPHVTFITLTFIAAVVVVAVLASASARHYAGRPVALCGGLLILLVFAQSGLLFRDFAPTIEHEYFYPVTPSLEEIRSRTGEEQTLWVDGAMLPPNSNLWYHLRSPGLYDALGVRWYDALYEGLLGASASSGAADPANLNALQAMGIQYVVTALPYPFSTREEDEPAAESDGARATEPLRPRQSISQTFRIDQPNFSVVSMPLAAYSRTNTCTLVVDLEDMETQRLVHQAETPCRDVKDDILYIMSFPAQPDSAGRRYRLTLRSPDASPDSTLAAYYSPTPLGGEELRVGEGTISGHLVTSTYASPISGLERVWADRHVSLFRVPGSLPRYYSVGEALPVRSDEEALGILQGSDFDITRQVLIQGGPPPYQADAGAGLRQTVQVIEETPTRIRLAVERDSPGWLVALQTYFPGWRSTVNGRSAELTRANLAFSAVAIGAGSSEVMLEYDPLSIKVGLLISTITVAGLLVLLVLLIRRRPPASAAPMGGLNDRVQ